MKKYKKKNDFINREGTWKRRKIYTKLEGEQKEMDKNGNKKPRAKTYERKTR